MENGSAGTHEFQERVVARTRYIVTYGLVGGFTSEGKPGIPCGENRFLVLPGRTIEMKKESQCGGGGGSRDEAVARFFGDRDSTDKSASLAASVIAIVPTKGQIASIKTFLPPCVCIYIYVCPRTCVKLIDCVSTFSSIISTIYVDRFSFSPRGSCLFSFFSVL